jgi:hypothetical protein
VAPRRYPDPHIASSWLRELPWTDKQKKCFCQACGCVPTVTPKAVLGNDLRPIGQEVASDHRSHFLQDTHTHACRHTFAPARTIYAMLTLVPPSAQDGYMRHDGAAVRRSPVYFQLAELLCVGHVTSVRSPVFTCHPNGQCHCSQLLQLPVWSYGCSVS